MKARLLRAVCAASLIHIGTAYGIAFTDLGELAGAGPGPSFFFPTGHVGLSRDGGVVFTSTHRWTAAGGWQTWDSYTGGAVTDGVRAVSSNGSIVAGNSGDAAYHWSASTGVTAIGGFPSSYSVAAKDISADGSIVIGTSTDPTSTGFGTEAFKWIASGTVGLGSETEANAITADGSIIAGTSPVYPPPGAAFWTAGSNWTTLPSPPDTGDYASGIAENGTLIVNAGQSRFYPPRLWSPANGYSDLGEPTISSPFENLALDISSDARIVVGAESATCDGCAAAWVWDEVNGRRSIENILTTAGIDLSDWEYLSGATSVSADGLHIVGSGLGTDGLSHGWLVTVPIPPALYLFGSGLLALVGVARRKVA